MSFFILRTNADLDTDYQDNELSLIEFPTDKLFNELWRFDLVVFRTLITNPTLAIVPKRCSIRSEVRGRRGNVRHDGWGTCL